MEATAAIYLIIICESNDSRAVIEYAKLKLMHVIVVVAAI